MCVLVPSKNPGRDDALVDDQAGNDEQRDGHCVVVQHHVHRAHLHFVDDLFDVDVIRRRRYQVHLTRAARKTSAHGGSLSGGYSNRGGAGAHTTGELV